MSTVKIATSYAEEHAYYKWATSDNVVSKYPEVGYMGTKTIAKLEEGRTYNFTTKVVNEDTNYPAVIVANGNMVTRQFEATGEDQNFSITLGVNEDTLYINNSEGVKVVVFYEQEADFDPKPVAFNSPQPFRFWCQTVLPLVYDDSLSYYELLAKVVKYINSLIKDMTNVENIYTNLNNAYTELEAYVNTYFDNLDVSEAINQKLDYMAEHGDFDALVAEALQRINYTAIINAEVDEQLPTVVDGKIGGVVADQIDASVASQINAVVASQIDGVVGEQIDASVAEQIGASVAEQITPIVGEQVAAQIGTAVSNWLARNFTQPPLDKTLSINNAAADSKVTGNAINYVKDISIEGYSRKEEELDTDFTNYSECCFVRAHNRLYFAEYQGLFNCACANNLTGGARYKITLNFDTSLSPTYANEPAGFICTDVVTPEEGALQISATILAPLEDYIGQYPNGSYYIDLPYNATAILFNSLNGTLCKGYKVTMEFQSGGEIEGGKIAIEEFAKGYIVPTQIRYGKKAVASGTSVSFADDSRYCCATFEFSEKVREASIRVSGYQDDFMYVAYNRNNQLVDAEQYTENGAQTITHNIGGFAFAKMHINVILNPHKVVYVEGENQFISEGIPYVTTEPTFSNTSGFLRVAVLDTEPSVRRAGWLYIIKQSVENGIILYEGADVNENTLYGELNNDTWGTP